MPLLTRKRGRLPGGSVVRGILLLARGRAAGMLEFANSGDALAASLAPLIAFPLVGSGLIGLSGHPGMAAIVFLSRLCGVLALPVITHAYAKLTRREGFWLCTATALNWSFWILIPLLLIAAFLGALLVEIGVSEQQAEAAVIVLLGAYMLWLHWFIVRTGLQLSAWPAAGLVIFTNAAIGLLTFGPDLVDILVRK